jgi:hypothetical protein
MIGELCEDIFKKLMCPARLYTDEFTYCFYKEIQIKQTSASLLG